ncbi:MAG: 3-methyl-2-oxobutanoate hydroxymethyltransferase [Bacteriovoracia bacterium]
MSQIPNIKTNKKITAPLIRGLKHKRIISMLTAYDYPTAKLIDQSEIDMILVGDSVATVLYGEPDTLSVTMEDMIRHTKSVSKAVESALVIADMPFMSYQVSAEQAVTNAGRLLKEAKAHAVKLEGGLEVYETVKKITQAGIPVMGHIGLTPQSIHAQGRYRMHGKETVEQQYLITSAKKLEEAGCFCVVLECVDQSLAKEITQLLEIPTIGIGSGKFCDGQVLVTQDLLGMTLGHVPRFVEQTANLKEQIQQGIVAFKKRNEAARTETSIHVVSEQSTVLPI